MTSPTCQEISRRVCNTPEFGATARALAVRGRREKIGGESILTTARARWHSPVRRRKTVHEDPAGGCLPCELSSQSLVSRPNGAARTELAAVGQINLIVNALCQVQRRYGSERLPIECNHAVPCRAGPCPMPASTVGSQCFGLFAVLLGPSSALTQAWMVRKACVLSSSRESHRTAPSDRCIFWSAGSLLRQINSHRAQQMSIVTNTRPRYSGILRIEELCKSCTNIS